MKAYKLSSLLVPALLFLVITIAGIAAVQYAESLVTQATDRLRIQTQALSAARQKHANAGLEKDILTRFRETYDALEKVGFIGAEQRINWVDGLRTANRESKLFGVEYQIGQQEPYPYAADLGVGDLPIRQAIMKLKMPLLHEGDLMPFFRALAARSAGVFTMNACILRRVGVGVQETSQPNLGVECDLAWVSVMEVENAEERP